jgi:hypothetical protein
MDPAVRAKADRSVRHSDRGCGKACGHHRGVAGIPSPRWNSIFAHYRIGADLPSRLPASALARVGSTFKYMPVA